MDFIPTIMGSYRLFQMWKLVCNFKRHFGDCGEWILEGRVIIEKKAGILTRGDDGDGDRDTRYTLEVDPEGLDDKLGMRVDEGEESRTLPVSWIKQQNGH